MDNKSNGISFELVFEGEDICQREVSGCPPPPMMSTSPNAKRTRTKEEIERRQKRAAERKLRYQHNRLERIKKCQENAQRIAENVQYLMKFRDEHKENPEPISKEKMTKIKEAANDVGKSFRLLNDFTTEYRQAPNRKSKADPLSPANNTALVSNMMPSDRKKSEFAPKRQRSTSFTITCDDEDQKKSPKKKPPKLSPRKQRIRTADDIEEDLKKAEERRQRRLEHRSQRARENRENLLDLANKMDRLFAYEKAKEDRIRSIYGPTTTTESSLEQTDVNSPITRSEYRQLAKEVSEGFAAMSQRYEKDLALADRLLSDN